MPEILAGKEVDVKFDNGAGSAFVDVDATGKIECGVKYNKELDLNGYAKVKTNNDVSIETNIVDVLGKYAAATENKVDDKIHQGIKTLLALIQGVN